MTSPLPPRGAVRADLERQFGLHPNPGPSGDSFRNLQAVVAFLDDSELDALLDLAVARFVDPPPARMLLGGIAVHQVDARLVARHGWVAGIAGRQASRREIAWRWWWGAASGTPLSEADAVAGCAAKSE